MTRRHTHNRMSSLGAVVCALLAAFPLAGLAKDGCSNSTLNGSYSLQASGNIILPPATPITGPFGRAGRSLFDGKGAVSNITVASYNGLIFNDTYTGTYQVNADCTAQVTANLGPPVNLPVSFTGVISEDGDLGQFMLINPPGTTIHVTIRRQRKKCSHEDLEGSYTLESSGVILPPSPLAGPFARVGKFVNDSGNFVASTTASYNGLPVGESFSGTYVVNADCTVEFTYNAPPPQGPVTAKYFGAFSDNGDKVVFIVSAPAGEVIVGSLTKQ